MIRDYSDPTFMRPLAPLVLPAVYDDVLSYEEWLSKVIHRMNEISDMVNKTIGDIDTLVGTMIESKVTTLQSQINVLKASIETIQGEVDGVDDKIADAVADTKAYADEAIRVAIGSLGNIESKIAIAKQQAIEASKNYTDLQTAELNTKINSFRLSVYDDMTRRLATVNARIDNIIKEYPFLYNPTTGFNEDMQTLVYNLYKNLRTLGIMAMTYDDQELTAQAYDDMNLRAIDYDVRMYQILFNDLREMFNPFTGKLSSLRDVLGDLIRRLQWNGKTVEEAEDFDFTASLFDASTFNAYEQDTNKYLTKTDPDTKNKSYRNWLFVGEGNTITVPEELTTDGSQFAVLNYEGDITYIDMVTGTYGDITITYNDGVFTITGDSIRVYVVTRVFDVSDLDK